MIIWLASFPKSGNTLLRILLSNYFFFDYQKSENPFESLDKILKFPGKKEFTNLLNKLTEGKNLSDSDVFKLNVDNWIYFQQIIDKPDKIIYFKTHNIYSEKFTNSKLTKSFIYLIRDPRNIVLSYANHLNISHKESLKKIVSNNFVGIVSNNIYEVYGSWELNYLTWNEFKDVDGLFIKYEDLISNTEEQFLKVLKHLNKSSYIKIDEKKIEKVVNLSDFEKLKNSEKKIGFKEAVGNQIFFDKGPSRKWQNELEESLAKEIEKKFNKTMRIFNYL